MGVETKNGQSHVYYRFSSSKDFDFVRFDGEFITIGELKYLISKKTGVWKDRTTVIELFEPRTQEEYKQNNRMIRKNASVIAKRSPAVRAPPIALQAKESEPRSKSEPLVVPANAEAKEKEEEDPFGPDAFAPAPDEDEDAAVKQLAKGLHQSWQVELNARGGQAGSWGRGRGVLQGPRGRGGRNRGGRGLGIPPYGYVCHRCNIPGHYIEDCPTNGDPAYDFKRVRYPTGIPSSMLEKDDQGGLLMPNGERARLKPNLKKFEQEMAGVPKPDRYKNQGGGEGEGDEKTGGQTPGEKQGGDSGGEGGIVVKVEGGDLEGRGLNEASGMEKPEGDERQTMAIVEAGPPGGGSGGGTAGGANKPSPWNALMSLPSFVDPFGMMFPVVKNNLPDATLGQLRRAFFEGRPIPEDDFQKFREDHRSEMTMREQSNRREESVGTVERGRSPLPGAFREREQPPIRIRSRSPPPMYHQRKQRPLPRDGPPPDYRPYPGDYVGPMRPPPAGMYERPWGPEGRHWQPGPFPHEPEWFPYGERPFPHEPVRPPGYMHGPPPYPPYHREMYHRDLPHPRMEGFGPREEFQREFWGEMEDPRYARREFRGPGLHPEPYGRFDEPGLPPREFNPPRGPRIEEPPSVSGDRDMERRYMRPIPRSPDEVRSAQLRRFSGEMGTRIRRNSPDMIMGRPDPNHRKGMDPVIREERASDRVSNGVERSASRPTHVEYPEASSDKSVDEKVEKPDRLMKPVVVNGTPTVSEGARMRGEGPLRRGRSGEFDPRIHKDDRFVWSPGPGPDIPEFARRSVALRHADQRDRPQPMRGPPLSPPRSPLHRHPNPELGRHDDRFEWEEQEMTEQERRRGRVFFEECKRKQRDLRDVLQEAPEFVSRRGGPAAALGPGPRIQSDAFDFDRRGDEYGRGGEVEFERQSSLPQRPGGKIKHPRVEEPDEEEEFLHGGPPNRGFNVEEDHWRGGRPDSVPDRGSLSGDDYDGERPASVGQGKGEHKIHAKDHGSPGGRWELEANVDFQSLDDDGVDPELEISMEQPTRHKHRSEGGKKRKSGKKRHRDEHKSKGHKSEKSRKYKRAKDGNEGRDRKTSKAKREAYID
ncbi:hypothetical protein BSKO_01273 [Bryopsis sp. KO-2023]|nr:hypothetical protein BSKO_01273 [Bryopsis sp. KO-2023]